MLWIGLYFLIGVISLPMISYFDPEEVEDYKSSDYRSVLVIGLIWPLWYIIMFSIIFYRWIDLGVNLRIKYKKYLEIKNDPRKSFDRDLKKLVK